MDPSLCSIYNPLFHLHIYATSFLLWFNFVITLASLAVSHLIYESPHTPYYMLFQCTLTGIMISFLLL